MPRFLAAKPDADLIRLPWAAPLDQWPTQYLVALPRGISRHVVRFLQVGDEILAAKEILEEVAVQEYRLLTELRHLGIPSVEPVGVVLGRVVALAPGVGLAVGFLARLFFFLALLFQFALAFFVAVVRGGQAVISFRLRPL